MLDTLSRSGGQLQSILGAGGTGGALAAGEAAGMALQPPDPAQVAAAVARYQGYRALREFRARLYGCLTARPDASLELCDAILCADHAVTSLVQLSLVPEFRRGHGALYDALAGVAAEAAAQVRDACARWRRLRFAVDATPYPRPDAGCSPGRGHVHHDACRCDGTRKTVPGWECQFTAALGHLRTAWAALADAERTTPATRTRHPHPPDGPAGAEPAAPPARGRPRRRRRTAGHPGRRVQRRRADLRAARLPRAPAHPAGQRPGVASPRGGPGRCGPGRCAGKVLRCRGRRREPA